MDSKSTAERLIGQGIDPYTCQHKGATLCRARDAAGRAYYIKQCQRCYKHVGSAVGRDRVTGREPDEMPVNWDYFYELKRRVSVSIRADQHAEWLDEHAEYLQSPEWKAKRQLVMKRAGGICEGCGERRAIQVHHTTYAHWRHEFLWELKAVCEGCHARAHPDKELTHL